MAKKKTAPPQLLSPEKYIRTKARGLPVVECLINSLFRAKGVALIIIARQHKSGNYTVGCYLLDLYCRGVKDSYYCFNIPPREYAELIEEVYGDQEMLEIGYNEVHNLIYGAVAYAQGLHLAPHKDYETTQYLLAEDTDDIPLIEYEYGKDGKPLLIADTELEADRCLSSLLEAVGNQFRVVVAGHEMELTPESTVYDDDKRIL